MWSFYFSCPKTNHYLKIPFLEQIAKKTAKNRHFDDILASLFEDFSMFLVFLQHPKFLTYNSPMTKNEKFRVYLKERWESKKRKNPDYSLRNFAKDIGMNPGYLSLLFNGKKHFTDKMILKVCRTLKLSDAQIKKRFFTDPYKEKPLKVLNKFDFSNVAHWFFDALLELSRVRGFKSNPQWISQALGISEDQAQSAIGNLKMIDWLDGDNKKVQPIYGPMCNYVNDKKSTSTVLKRLQFEANELSRQSLENDDISKRYHATDTLAIDVEKIEEAKEYIREFRNRFCTKVSKTSQNLTGVYQLNVSFYRLDQEVIENDDEDSKQA